MKTETVVSVMERIAAEVQTRLGTDLHRIGLAELPDKLTLLGLKEEQRLEVYVQLQAGWVLLKSYPFTANSGVLGPKLKEGDRQIPEGIYGLEYLNPNSSYYLSMKINYPNEFDMAHSTFETKAELGSDIFIHGKAVSVGCIAIGDKAIEELFFLVQSASIENVKVIISPRDFRTAKAYPKVADLDWTEDLYDLIKGELMRL